MSSSICIESASDARAQCAPTLYCNDSGAASATPLSARIASHGPLSSRDAACLRLRSVAKPSLVARTRCARAETLPRAYERGQRLESAWELTKETSSIKGGIVRRD
eukprot:6212169-Pleurochrysis_carterae.AAC.6